MQTTVRKSPFWLVAGLVGLLVLSTMACSFGGMTIGSNSAVIDVTLNEDEINKMIDHVTVEKNDPDFELLETVTSVEMMDGFIRVHGTTKDANGATVEGSYDAGVSVKDNILVVQIVNVDIPGIDLSDPRVEKVNQNLMEGLTKSVTESNGEVLYKEASVKDGVLRLKVQVNYNIQ